MMTGGSEVGICSGGGEKLIFLPLEAGLWGTGLSRPQSSQTSQTFYETYMLVNCGLLNGRDILYCHLGNDLAKTGEFPTANWLLFAIADKDQLGLLYSFAEKCLDRGVLYICGAGEACSEIDDAFDFVVLDRKLAGLKRDLTEDDFDDSPMTTWHNDFDEGFWFAATTAYHEVDPIQHVIVANLTEKSYEFRIRDLVTRINSGWLPSD